MNFYARSVYLLNLLRLSVEWHNYPTVKKFWRQVYLFRQNTRTWWTDGQTDRRRDGWTDTAWRHRPRLCVALRGKNSQYLVPFPIYWNFRNRWFWPLQSHLTPALGVIPWQLTYDIRFQNSVRGIFYGETWIRLCSVDVFSSRKFPKSLAFFHTLNALARGDPC